MAEKSPNDKWQHWHDEFELARKAKGFKSWQDRSKKIVERYRDYRGDLGASDGATEPATGARFNILWSNVQTLMPALFAKTPKPVVERRYLDRDDVGRTASVILERALLYQLEEGGYHAALRKAVLDRLLPGRGVVWVRYEPKFVPMQTRIQKTDGDEKLTGEDNPTDEQVASESTPVDYVDWKDFMTNPARTWEEVTWIDKRVYMTREELTKRFGAKGKEVTLDWTPIQEQKAGPGTSPDTGRNEEQKRGTVHETWDKTKRKVTWWAESYSDDILDEKDDPLKLEGFWPVPKPLFATTTNETLVPVPDYYEYQDQAVELDELTGRISALTRTIKTAGVYDASLPELQRMFDEGFENKLVPADNMAEFMSKAGTSGMGHIWLLPIKDMAETLIHLYGARDQVKQTLYEITGISDIVRGQSSAGDKTATEQRIKGQFASMRLNDMQAEVARFARDTLRIMGEIIAEHFDPMTLFLVSGYEQYAKEQFPPDVPENPMMGHNGGPPMDPAQPVAHPGSGAPGPMASSSMAAGQQPIMLPPDPELVAKQKAAEMFKKAVELLRNDKLRGFRIDIETDSLVEPDQQATQQARTELLAALSQFLPQAIEAGAAMPELKPLMARLLMFFLRGFKASRDIEAAFEQFIDDLTKDAANPKPTPPSPEEIKAKAEMAKQAAETQRIKDQAAIDQQNAIRDADMKDRENQGKMMLMDKQMEIKERELVLKEREIALKEREMQMGAAIKERQAQINIETTEREAAIQGQQMEHEAALGERQHEQTIEAGDHKHELGLEVMAAKAKQAKTPKPAGASK